MPREEPKLKDVMTHDPVCVGLLTPIRELARVFHDNQISGAPVVDAEGKVVGLVSRLGLLQRCCSGEVNIQPEELNGVVSENDADMDIEEAITESFICVRDFMTENPPLVVPGMSVVTLARFMCETRHHRAVVVDENGYPLGIVTSLDLLEALLSLH